MAWPGPGLEASVLCKCAGGTAALCMHVRWHEQQELLLDSGSAPQMPATRAPARAAERGISGGGGGQCAGGGHHRVCGQGTARGGPGQRAGGVVGVASELEVQGVVRLICLPATQCCNSSLPPAAGCGARPCAPHCGRAGGVAQGGVIVFAAAIDVQMLLRCCPYSYFMCVILAPILMPRLYA